MDNTPSNIPDAETEKVCSIDQTTEENVTNSEDNPRSAKHLKQNDQDLKTTEAEFREIDINEPSEKTSKPQVNSFSPGMSVVENITMMGRKYSLREWSKSTLVYTKQLLSENFGFGTKTVDMDLEKQIDLLEESKRLCNYLYLQCQNISKCLATLTLAEKEFGLMMYEMSLKETTDYKEELACNGEMFKSLSKTNTALEGVVNMFSDNMATLSNKTIEDCIQSVRLYDTVRIEYDAYRVQYEEAKKQANGNAAKLKEAEDKFQSYLQKFNRTRADVCTKMKLVEENKTKVLKRNLMILQEALVKRFREASDNMAEISSHYEFRPNTARSWLENSD